MFLLLICTQHRAIFQEKRWFNPRKTVKKMSGPLFVSLSNGGYRISVRGERRFCRYKKFREKKEPKHYVRSACLLFYFILKIRPPPRKFFSKKTLSMHSVPSVDMYIIPRNIPGKKDGLIQERLYLKKKLKESFIVFAHSVQDNQRP